MRQEGLAGGCQQQRVDARSSCFESSSVMLSCFSLSKRSMCSADSVGKAGALVALTTKRSMRVAVQQQPLARQSIGAIAGRGAGG